MAAPVTRHGIGGRAGFTILELMVALVVSAMVLAVAYAAVHQATEGAARLRRERAASLAGPAARAAMEGWLRAATGAAGQPFVGHHRPSLGGPDRDDVSFAVLDAGVLWPGPHRITLRIGDAGTAAPGLVAELVSLRNVAPAETVKVAVGATSLSLRYRTRDGQRGAAPRWSDLPPAAGELPGAVELRVAGAGVDPVLALPLRVPLGIEEP